MTVLLCHAPSDDDRTTGDDPPARTVGRRPGKAIDPLLAGASRVCVVGDDADLNAVVLRLLRTKRLGAVEVSYAPAEPTEVSRMYGLPTGSEALRLAATPRPDLPSRLGADAVAPVRSPDPPSGPGRVNARAGAAPAAEACAVPGAEAGATPVPLVRNDAGGVLLGEATLGPITTPFYVDAERVTSGAPMSVRVRPDLSLGLAVTVTPRRVGLRRVLRVGSRAVTRLGRAVEFGLGPDVSIAYDGLTHPRPVNRWVFYAHTEPLLLLRPSHAAPDSRPAHEAR
jgi:hypothetical protein